MFLKSTVRVTTERIHESCQNGPDVRWRVHWGEKVTVGYEFCKICQRPNQQTASQIFFWDWSFWKALFIFQKKSQCAYIYFTIIYSIFQTSDYNISNSSTQWNITSVDMSTLTTLNTYCKIEIEFLIILKVRHRGSRLPTELQAVYSSSQSEVFEDVPYPTSRGVFGLHTPPPWKFL